MQKLTPNYNCKYNFDVTSSNFDPVKLRNGEICPEYSRKNASVENYDFIMQPYETIPQNFRKQRIGSLKQKHIKQ